MAVQPCVRCHTPVAVGSVTCPVCGVEHPHRQRPLRAQALAKRRLVVLGAVLLALVAFVALSFTGGGSKRSAQCRAYDEAQAQYDHALSAGEDVMPEQLAEVDRLHAACTASER